MDSGTHYSLINNNVAKRLNLAITNIDPDTSINLYAAEGSQIFIIGSVDLDLFISGLHIVHTVYVVNNLCNDQLLLGGLLWLKTAWYWIMLKESPTL